MVLLTKFNYKECNKLLDGRLVICTVAVCCSLYGLLWDYLYPFPLSRNALIVCVISYFVVMAILAIYTTYVEINIFCSVRNVDADHIEPDDVWLVSSTIKRFDHIYNLTLQEKKGTTGEKTEASLALPIEKYFDTAGKMLYSKLANDVSRLHSDIKKKKN